MRPKNKNLTPIELNYMKILWRLKEVSIQEIQNVLPPGKRPQYTTITTMLRIMEAKGYLAHKEKDGKYYYYPLLSEQRVKRSVIKDVIKNIFDGKSGELILNLVKEENLSDKEIRKIKDTIKERGRNV